MEIDNTKMIAESIFSKAPGPINSIQLELEETTTEFAVNNKSGVDSFIEEILCNIIYHGIKIIFHYNERLVKIPFNTITIANFTILMKLLSEKEIDLLQEYTKSFGYKIKFDWSNFCKESRTYYLEDTGDKNIYKGFEKVY